MVEVTLREGEGVWRDRFERERERVREASPTAPAGVFHVGSTAVEDLPTKPALDLLAVFPDREAVRAATAGLRDAGYDDHRDDPDWVVLVRESGDWDVVVHLRPPDTDAWHDQLVLREYLRDSAAARREYERTKRAALARHPDDVDAYTDAKAETVRSLTADAYERGYDDVIPAWARTDGE